MAIGLDESSARARISRYELGVHEPPFETVKLLAEALQATAPYFYCEDDDVAQLLLALWAIPSIQRAGLINTIADLVISVRQGTTYPGSG